MAVQLKAVALTLVAVVAAIALLWEIDAIYVYGDATTENEGIVVGVPQACLGLEWRGEPGVFDCRLQGV